MADQAKGKGIAPKRASNPADPGQSSRPLLSIRTLSEDKEDGEDYSKVIEVLKQHIKSYKRDSVSAIKNISSTLASLTNSSNAVATTTGKTSYSPRFDPFSGTIDLDSPLHPPRKEPYLGPAVNSATSNLDPPIDTGSKEGFKDTITSSIVKELSKKAYTIPDDSKLSGESNFEQWIQALSIVLRALGISNFLETPDISNTYSNSDQAVLFILLRDSLSSSPRAAISWIYIPSKAFKLLIRQYSRPIESKKEDIYNELHALTFSTYRKGLLAFNAEFNGYLAKLTIAKIDIDPSLILNYLNIEYLIANILEESSKPAIEAYRAAYIANSSNSTPNSNSNPSKKGKNKKKAIEEEEESDSSSNSRYKKRKDFKGKGLKTSSNNKAKYKDNQPRRRPRDPALYNSWLYDKGSIDHISNSKEQFTTFTPNIGQLRPFNTGNRPVSPASIGSITLEVLSRKAPPTYTKLVLDNVLYLPNININIVSRVRYYNSGGCLIKETLYRGNRRYIAVLDFKKSVFFLDVKGSSKPILYRNKIVVEIPSNSIRKEDYRPIIEDAIVSEAIEPNKRYKLRNSPAKGTTLEERYRAIGARGEAIIPLEKRSKSLKFTSRTEECKLLAVLGSKTYLVYIPSRRAVLKTSTVKFIEDNTVLSQPTDNIALEGELVDLDLDLEGAVSLDPSNLNTEEPISIEIGPSKLEPYESSSDKPIFAPKPIEVIAPNQPITNEPLDNSNLILKGDKMQLDYYKLLAKTSSYILSFVYKARKRVISKDSTPTTYKQVLKLPRDEHRAFFKSALREEIYMEIPKGLLDLVASNKAIYKLLLKYSYNPSTPNIIKLSKALYSLKQSPREWQDKLKILLKSLGYLPLISDPGVFYNAKTCHFIITYIDDCLFIGPNIGYITDLKKRLNKVYTIEDLGPAAYFLGWLSRSLNRPTKSHLNAAKNLFKYLNSTKDYSIYFSCNGNTVADLGPKLSNSSNITTKLSRDFHSKEGPRPLTTTSTTIVDSRNSKGSSRTSIINSSLVPIGFSDSDFAGDKATSKSTYGYLYKLAGRPISWKTKRATTIALSTLEAETDGLTEAIREVQWIIGLFSELHRPIDHPITLYRDNQGSIIVANDPALHARTKHTLLKFRYIKEQVKAKIVTIIYLNTKFFY
ncbi:hypothetical protein P8C59_005615 [Phyllachora maydis]|uniref:Reverse transcriptase Ty1/copia-type domain-containing protein n=1 Tax=Phyllachora maydis TaxID=1825666 RepID=A0AAD9I5W6_9PEZI|nr:hypothetical protein P8C59_005615 [Phyllachora maydis]